MPWVINGTPIETAENTTSNSRRLIPRRRPQRVRAIAVLNPVSRASKTRGIAAGTPEHISVLLHLIQQIVDGDQHQHQEEGNGDGPPGHPAPTIGRRLHGLGFYGRELTGFTHEQPA